MFRKKDSHPDTIRDSAATEKIEYEYTIRDSAATEKIEYEYFAKIIWKNGDVFITFFHNEESSRNFVDSVHEALKKQDSDYYFSKENAIVFEKRDFKKEFKFAFASKREKER